MGFVIVGDEGKDMIPLKTVKFLERVGTYVGSTVRSLEAQDKVRRSEPGLPGPAEDTATASHGSDEMELLIRLIEHSNESIVISQDWRIIYVNAKCAQMAGLSKQDMIGLAFLDITHPDDRPA
jgi:PAS domain-containing protein